MGVKSGSRLSKKLIGKARQGMENAHTPVHSFPVGAAVLTERGNIYQGCNVESIIQGLGVCAERNAVNNAVSNGEKEFRAVAIVSSTEEPIAPCGACRQYIGEFAQYSSEKISVVMVGNNKEIRRKSLNELLPERFNK